MNVVAENDGAAVCLREDDGLGFRRIAMLPVEAVHVPQDALVAPRRVCPCALLHGECAIRRAHERGCDAGGLLDDVVRAVELIAHGLGAELGELRVVPRVVGDLVSLVHDLFRDFGILRDTFAAAEKRGVDSTVAQHFQKARRVSAMRAIVEGDRDVGAFDIALSESDARRGWCGGWCGDRSFGGAGGKAEREK